MLGDVRRVASSSGVRVAVHDLGGNGPLVLAAHANGFHGRVLGPMAEALAGRYAFKALDLRGHGDTVTPVGVDYAWAGFADDVLAAVDDLGPCDLVGFGHSVGGAALLGAEHARPGTFTGLYVYEPIVFPSVAAAAPAQDNFADLTARRRSVFDSRDAALANFEAKEALATLDRRALLAYVDHGFAARPDGTVEIKCPPEVEAAIYRRAAHHGLFEALGDIACPVTVAVGDEAAPAARLAPAVAARLPRAALERFAGLGHLGPLQDPGRVARSVGRAFDALPAR